MGLNDLFPATNPSDPVVFSLQEDAEFTDAAPTVWSLCCTAFHEDGKPRQVSTLLFFIEAGAWKARLSERNHHLDLWGGGPTFRAALESLEGQLTKRPVPWRKQTPMKSGR